MIKPEAINNLTISLMLTVLMSCRTTQSTYQGKSVESCPLSKPSGLFIDVTDTSKFTAEKVAVSRFKDEFQIPNDIVGLLKIETLGFCEEEEGQFTVTVGIAEESLDSVRNNIKEEIDAANSSKAGKYDLVRQQVVAKHRATLWNKAVIFLKTHDIDIGRLPFRSIDRALKTTMADIDFGITFDDETNDQLRSLFRSILASQGVQLSGTDALDYKITVQVSIEDIPKSTSFQYVRLIPSVFLKNKAGTTLSMSTWNIKGGGSDKAQAIYDATTKLRSELEKTLLFKLFGGAQ